METTGLRVGNRDRRLRYTTHTGETFTYPNLANQFWLEPWLVVNYTSTRPDVVTFDIRGNPTLHANFYAPVLVKARMCCTPDTWDATPWINLLPEPEDIDLGTDVDNRYSAFYHPDPNATSFETHVWARPKDGQYLRATQLECVFPAGLPRRGRSGSRDRFDESRRRRGRDVEIPWRRVAAPPRTRDADIP